MLRGSRLEGREALKYVGEVEELLFNHKGLLRKVGVLSSLLTAPDAYVASKTRKGDVLTLHRRELRRLRGLP